MTRKQLDRLLERSVAEALGVDLKQRQRRKAAAPRRAVVAARQRLPAVAEMSHA